MSVNLCSISGAKNGGKDLVTSIIQLIERWYDTSTGTSFRKEYPNGVVQFVGHHLRLDKRSSLRLTSKWQNKKFGYKLKQVASILLGVPVEKFEDREFKDSLLGEEWSRWKVTFNISENLTDFRYFNTKEEAIRFYPTIIPVKEILDVRKFLQICGTKCMRDNLNPNVWVNGLFSEINEDDYVILSDTRFTNELQRVKDYGGITVKIDSDERLEIQNIAKAERLAMIRLTNENDDCFYEDSEGQYHLLNDKYQEKYTKYYNEEFNKLEDTHESETAWRDWEFDYVIDNNKDIFHLIKEVEKFYKHYKL